VKYYHLKKWGVPFAIILIFALFCLDVFLVFENVRYDTLELTMFWERRGL
jgi:hypothetical protein